MTHEATYEIFGSDIHTHKHTLQSDHWSVDKERIQ